eukprot:scaffold59457_cov61-Phaeocystis_antarctica.AAC.1
MTWRRPRALGLDELGEVGEARGEVARGTAAEVVQHDVPPRRDAVGHRVARARALERRLCELRVRVIGRGRLRLLGVVALARLAHDRLDLALILLLQLAAVLGPHEGRGVLEGEAAQAGAVALDDGGGEDGHHVHGELRDVARDAHEHARAGQQHEAVRQLLRHADLLQRELAVRVEQDLVGDAVVAQLLLLPRDDDGGLGGLRVVTQRHVQPEDVVGVLGHAVGLAHEEVDEGVGEHIGARTAHDLDGLVDCPLAALQEEAQGLTVVLTHEPELPRLLVVLLALVVDGHLLVLLGQTLLAEGLGVGLHAAVRHGELERLLGALGEDEELDRGAMVAHALAVLRDEQRPQHTLGIAHEGEGALWLLQLLEVQSHHGVHIVGAAIGVRRLLELALRLLGLRKLAVELGRRDACHQRRGGRPVLGAYVNGGGLVGLLPRLIQARGLLVLPQPVADGGAVTAALRLARVEGQLHSPLHVALPQRHACDAHAAQVRLLRLVLALLLLRPLLQPLLVRHLLGREGLGQLERLLPLQQIPPHLERRHGARRLQEELLRGRVVVEDEGDVACEQRHHHARVHQLPVDAHRERDVEVLQRLVAELGIELALVDQQGHVPCPAHAQQREVLIEALLEALDAAALLGGDGRDGLVRREDGVADGAVGALRGDHAIVHEDRGAARATLGGADQSDGAALDRVRRVHEGVVALGVHRDEDAPVRRIPHDSDRARLCLAARDGEGLLAHGVVDEGLRVGVDEDEALGQVEVDDGAAPRRVDEELLGERGARDILLAVLREDARARLHVLAAQGLQVHAALGEHGHVVSVELDALHRAQVLTLVHHGAAALREAMEVDVVVHAERRVLRPQRDEGGLHGDTDGEGREVAIWQRRADAELEERGEVDVARAVRLGQHGQAGEEAVDAARATRHREDLAVDRPRHLLELALVVVEDDGLLG